MNTRIIILLLIELLLAPALVWTLGGAQRRPETRAYVAWRSNPTTEARTALDSERAETFRRRVIFSVILFAGMAIITVPVVVALCGRRSSEIERDTQHAV
ncbi:MAG: hypothetical protein JWR69_198 [Pedosphaera sp.]|nr:hypothetical protein [Pedosphaera sp.]